METKVTYFRFFFLCIDVSCYKWPFKYHFSWLPQIFKQCVFIFIQFKIFCNFPFDYFGHGIFRLYYLVFKYLGILQISFCN